MTTVTSSTSESVNNVGSFWLPPSQIGSGGTRQFVGATFSIDAIGDVFNATTNIEFVNCFIALSAGNKIKLAANKNITLINTEIRNCTTRHNGIDATAGGSDVTITDSKISGGNTGVSIKSGTLVINNSQFNRNITHVRGELSSITVDGGSYKKSGAIPGPYSGGPQPCNFAFTLNKCGTATIYNVAEISDAGFGIKIIYGSLDCQGTSFKNCSAGIDLWNSPNTNLATDKPCYIGSGGNNPIPNSFANCKRAVRAGGKLVPCIISDNSIVNSSEYGIKVEYLKGRSFNISNNLIDDTKLGIYCYSNSTNSFNSNSFNQPKNIFGNYITANSQIANNVDINYNHWGIKVEETDLGTPSNNLRIFDNTLYDCRRGIDLKLCNSAEITGNTVYVNSNIQGVYDASGNVIDYCNGIAIAGCYGVKINENIVSSLECYPEPWNGWLQSGIRVDQSPNTVVCSNNVSNVGQHPLSGANLEIGDAFGFFGNCNPSVFKLNNIRSTVRGLIMANGETVIGQQGSLTNPRDNEWNIVSGHHTHNYYALGLNNRFFMSSPYYNASLSFINLWEPNLSPFQFNSNLVNSGTTNPCHILPLLGEQIDKYDDIAKDSTQIIGSEASSIFAAQEFLYDKLISQQNLQNYMTFAQFKDSVDAANLKHIDDIKRELTYPLDSAHIVSISEKNNSFYPLNNIENNYKDVFALAIANPELKDSTYTDVELEQLRAIASLCPYKEGNAVYLARVILHGFEDKEYLNKCEIVEPPNNNQRRANFGEEKNSEIKKLEKTSNPLLQINEFSVSPNPNNGKFRLICPSNSSFNYEFISITGQMLKSESVQNKNSIDFDFSHLSKGIYNLKITSLLTVKTIKISIH